MQLGIKVNAELLFSRNTGNMLNVAGALQSVRIQR